jgi:hypothetical protein
MKNLIFLLLCIVICCSRDNDTETDNTSQLPAETQMCANTFGCLVNGKLFYPRDGKLSTAGSANAVTWWGDTSEGSNLYRELDVNNFKDGKPINNFGCTYRIFLPKVQESISGWILILNMV